jgi:hypothetical protein
MSVESYDFKSTLTGRPRLRKDGHSWRSNCLMRLHVAVPYCARKNGSTNARASTRAPIRASSRNEPTSFRCKKMVSGGGGRRSPRRNASSNPSALTREGRSES